MIMSVFRLNTCCMCVSLDVGAKVIGFLCTLLAAFTAVLYGVPAARLYHHLATPTVTFYCVAFVASALHFVTGWAMLCGLYRKRPGLMWPWLALSWAMAGSLLLLSAAGILLMRLPTTAYVTSVYFIYSVLLLYLTAVVQSRREEILDEIKWDSGKRLMRPQAYETNLYV